MTIKHLRSKNLTSLYFCIFFCTKASFLNIGTPNTTCMHWESRASIYPNTEHELDTGQENLLFESLVYFTLFNFRMMIFEVVFELQPLMII